MEAENSQKLIIFIPTTFLLIFRSQVLRITSTPDALAPSIVSCLKRATSQFRNCLSAHLR